MVRWRDGAIEVDDGVVERVQEIGYPVVKYFFKVEEELTEVVWDYSRIIPPKDMIDWTTVIVVSGTDNLWFDEVEKGIDGYMDNSKG